MLIFWKILRGPGYEVTCPKATNCGRTTQGGPTSIQQGLGAHKWGLALLSGGLELCVLIILATYLACRGHARRDAQTEINYSVQEVTASEGRGKEKAAFITASTPQSP